MDQWVFAEVMFMSCLVVLQTSTIAVHAVLVAADQDARKHCLSDAIQRDNPKPETNHSSHNVCLHVPAIGVLQLPSSAARKARSVTTATRVSSWLSFARNLADGSSSVLKTQHNTTAVRRRP